MSDKKYLIFFVLILCHYLVYTQIKFDYGLKFGINLADLRTDEKTLSPRSTFHVGIEAEYPLTDKWGVQSELLYSRQGDARRGRTTQGVKFDNTTALDYFNIPVIINYYVAEGLYVAMGPQLGFLVRAQLEQTVGFDNRRDNVEENYKNADFSAVFGAGYKTDWGFVVGLRYNLGFTNVLKNPYVYTNQERHSVFQLSMSYRFNSSKK